MGCYLQSDSRFKAITTNLSDARRMNSLLTPLQCLLGLDKTDLSSLPVLIGSDLKKFLNGRKPAYLALLINDWSGDGIYSKDKLFSSLQDHEYDHTAEEVRIKGTAIVIHVGGCTFESKWLSMNNLGRLFQKG